MAKQNNKLKGKLQLQGFKNLILDQIGVEIDGFWEYLNYMKDKIYLVDSSLTKCNVVEEVLQQRPIKKSQSTIKFLKQASNETMTVWGVKDICAIMIWEKWFI